MSFEWDKIEILAQPHMEYTGFRVFLHAKFGKMKDKIQIDIGVGDLVKPLQNEIKYGNVPPYLNKEQLDSDEWNCNLFEPLLDDISKLIFYGVPVGSDSFNLWVEKNISLNSPPIVRVFLYDLSSKYKEIGQFLNPIMELPEENIVKSKVNSIFKNAFAWMLEKNYKSLCFETPREVSSYFIEKIFNPNEKIILEKIFSKISKLI
jgi:hypothetical protein